MQVMQGFGGSIRETSNMLLYAVREKPVLFEKFQEDKSEADVLSFEEWRPVDWIPQ